jgi:TonB family protein
MFLLLYLELAVVFAVLVVPAGFASAQDAAPAKDEIVRGCGPIGPHPCTPPRGTYMPSPDYSEKARKKKIEGNVMLSVIVGTDGLPRYIRITRTLGYGLDEKAIEAVQKWRFTPATREGHPVATEIAVQVQFKLY